LRFYCQSKYLSNRFNRLFRQIKYLAPDQQKTWMKLLEGRYNSQPVQIPGPDNIFAQDADQDAEDMAQDNYDSATLDYDGTQQPQAPRKRLWSGNTYLALACPSSAVPLAPDVKPSRSIVKGCEPLTTDHILENCTIPQLQAYMRALRNLQLAQMSEANRWFLTIRPKDLPVRLVKVKVSTQNKKVTFDNQL
jgi:hypothetical protein